MLSTPSLWKALFANGPGSPRFLWAKDREVRLDDLHHGSYLGGRIDELRGRAVLLSTNDELSAALALIELDGLARRIILCPPDLSRDHIPYIVSTADVDAVVFTDDEFARRATGVSCRVRCAEQVAPTGARGTAQATEWVLFTSGTTGVPKMVVHNLSTLAGAIQPAGMLSGPIVWATFYDIRRYGGLQILLRALFGGGSLVLSAADEAADDFLARAGQRGARSQRVHPPRSRPSRSGRQWRS